MLVKKSLINSWATAIADIAISEKKVDAFVDQSSAIVDLLKMHPDFIALLSVHTGSDKTRLHIVDAVFDKKEFDIYIIHALDLIVISDLIFHARDIFKLVRKLLANHKKTTFGTVWSVTELDEKTIKVLESKISAKMGKDVRLINKIDKTLLGGVQVIVSGQNFDGSLKGKLLDMKANILGENNIDE